MFKLLDKKIFSIYAQHFCLSGPMHNWSRGFSYISEVRGVLNLGKKHFDYQNFGKFDSV